MTTNFKVGDRVRFINHHGFAAQFGAMATVYSLPNDYDKWLRVTWDLTDARVCGQYDGGYSPHMFEVVVKSRPTIANDLRLKPQTKTVLRHLRKGQHISPMQALVVYSISRLAPCIHDIRKAGYNVSTEVKRDAQGHKYAQYALVA